MTASSDAATVHTLRAAAPAKLNLYLHIVGRRADGYHLLDSLIAFAAVHDRLVVGPADRLTLEIAGPFAPSLAPEADNLVLRAARRLAQAGGVQPRARIALEKRLPVAAGIGGGSADAAAALRLLADLWRLRPAANDLAALALELGADVPVCLVGRAAFVGGIGEEITAAPALPPAGLVLINPGRPVATQDVFARPDVGRSEPGRFKAPCPDAEALAEMLRQRRNDLAAAATGLVPEIGAVLDALGDRDDCLFAALSGSGATCFGLFRGEEDARRAANDLRRGNADWWVAATRLVGDCTTIEDADAADL